MPLGWWGGGPASTPEISSEIWPTPEIRAKKILGFRDVFFHWKSLFSTQKYKKIAYGALFFSSFALEFVSNSKNFRCAAALIRVGITYNYFSHIQNIFVIFHIFLRIVSGSLRFFLYLTTNRIGLTNETWSDLESWWISLGKLMDLTWKVVGSHLESWWISLGKLMDLTWEVVGSHLQNYRISLWKVTGSHYASRE